MRIIIITIYTSIIFDFNILDLQPFESFFGINLEPSAEDGDRGRQHDGDRVRIVRVSTDLNMDYVRVVCVSTI